MRTNRLGQTDLEISPIGFGAWALGGQWGAPRDDESVAAIHRALELGVNWIDTAPGYGCGHSERVVARALRGVSAQPLIFTKCGFVWDSSGTLTTSLKAASIRREIEASLDRLEVETIDLYQIHWREPDDEIEEAWATLADLRREGKVRWIGVSNFDVSQLERAREIAPVATLQPPFSLLMRSSLWDTPFVDNTPKESIEGELLPYCREHGIGVIVYSPMASGLLSGAMSAERAASFQEGDWRRDDPDFQEPNLSRTLALVERLRVIAARHNASVGELAIAWSLHHPAVAGAIVGVRRASQVDDLAGAADLVLRPEDLAEVDALARAA